MTVGCSTPRAVGTDGPRPAVDRAPGASTAGVHFVARPVTVRVFAAATRSSLRSIARALTRNRRRAVDRARRVALHRGRRERADEGLSAVGRPRYPVPLEGAGAGHCPARRRRRTASMTGRLRLSLHAGRASAPVVLVSLEPRTGRWAGGAWADRRQVALEGTSATARWWPAPGGAVTSVGTPAVRLDVQPASADPLPPTTGVMARRYAVAVAVGTRVSSAVPTSAASLPGARDLVEVGGRPSTLLRRRAPPATSWTAVINGEPGRATERWPLDGRVTAEQTGR